MNYYCNPLNVNYRYQFNKEQEKIKICREAADPSMILFQGKYYIFASMNLSVWVSEDLVHWESKRLPENLPLYDYAPDVRIIGDYVYFSASNNMQPCDFYRTKDIVNGPYEKIEGTFEFWDPNLFRDDDGRIYFYWGCSNMTPIYGVELNPENMHPMTEPIPLIDGKADHYGYERIGKDHSISPRTEAEVEEAYEEYLQSHGITEEEISPEFLPMLKASLTNRPFIEGAWMTKHAGKYYLQYAAPGAEYHTYLDGCYISDSPLGPFVLADNNPYSYKPGGFIPGAGHGSTMKDRNENWWHTSTEQISMNHIFERRVGIWPAGFDTDGELFCNQRYGDWPIKVDDNKIDPWKEPEWFLLSSNKDMTASSYMEGHEPQKASQEDIHTWWRAASSEKGEWLQMDLGEIKEVHAVQVNFADDTIDIPLPGEFHPGVQPRYIDEHDLYTRWKLEGSKDGMNWEIIEDKSEALTDLPHDFIVCENGMKVRYLKLTIVEVPYSQQPCVSGLRVFGIGEGTKPVVPVYECSRESALDMRVRIDQTATDYATGYNILWGHAPEKLYHSYMIIKEGKESTIEKKIGALVKEKDYYVRVDAFNEAGITHGKIEKIR